MLLNFPLLAKISVGIIVVATILVASADEPMPAPEKTMLVSPNKKAYATMDVDTNITTVYKKNQKGDDAPLWSMLGWFPVAFISNSGDYLAIGYDGNNLLNLDYKKNEPILYIVKHGELLRQFTLDQIITDFSKMPRTVSHYNWGTYIGFNSKDEFIIETFDNRQIALNIETGKIAVLEKSDRRM